MSKCKDCGQEVLWARTRGGKKLILDAEPNPLTGKVWLDPVTNTAAVLRRTWDREQARKRKDPLYTVHWGTCEAAEKFRRKGKWGA